jgi:hypothetical protein
MFSIYTPIDWHTPLYLFCGFCIGDWIFACIKVRLLSFLPLWLHFAAKVLSKVVGILAFTALGQIFKPELTAIAVITITFLLLGIAIYKWYKTQQLAK